MGNFLSARPANQSQRQLEMRFYCKYCIIRSRISVLAKKIRWAMAVVVEYSLDPMVLTKELPLFRLSASHWKPFFIPKCGFFVWSCLNNLIYTGNHIFSNFGVRYQNFTCNTTYCSSFSTHDHFRYFSPKDFNYLKCNAQRHQLVEIKMRLYQGILKKLVSDLKMK